MQMQGGRLPNLHWGGWFRTRGRDRFSTTQAHYYLSHGVHAGI